MFFLGSERNKTHRVSGRKKTDFSFFLLLLLFPTMEQVSLKAAALKATGTDIVNNGCYRSSSSVILACDAA